MSLDESIREIVRAELKPVVALLERLVDQAGAGDELLTPTQAAELVKVKPATLLQWRRAGALQNYGSTRAPRYRRSELLAVRVEQKAKSAPASVAARLLKRAS